MKISYKIACSVIAIFLIITKHDINKIDENKESKSIEQSANELQCHKDFKITLPSRGGAVHRELKLPKIEIEEDPKYTEEELDMLSRVIFAEAGSDWITDEHQLALGSVILNRIADERFPDTMREVVFAEGQYACTWDGNYYKTPNERAIKNAKYLLENGVTIPTDVVWQSQVRQGKGLWKKIQGHYFCY